MNIKPVGIDFRQETMNRPCPLRHSHFAEHRIRFGFANTRFYEQLVRAPWPVACCSSEQSFLRRNVTQLRSVSRVSRLERSENPPSICTRNITTFTTQIPEETIVSL